MKYFKIFKKFKNKLINIKIGSLQREFNKKRNKKRKMNKKIHPCLKTSKSSSSCHKNKKICKIIKIKK